MTQLAKVIDITETFVPVDPQAFPENMSFTAREDYPTRGAPIVPYEGYNFMPTSYGYKSYFGTNSTLGIEALTSRCDDIFIVQSTTFENILIALCEDGIWTKVGEAAGAWTHAVTLAIPESGSHLNWTKALIGNNLYLYRQGGASYYLMSPDAILAYGASIATGVTGLTAYAIDGSGTGLVAGAYTYSVAYFNSTGALSAPCTGVVATLGASGSVQLSWTKLTAAVTYRIYRTLAGVTYYHDLAQPSLATPVRYSDANIAWTAITLPDVTTSYVSIAAYAAQTVTPTFLNMTGQIGIFKAGGRLGFFDSANSVAWSSIDILSEFTPDIQTLAGSAVFTEVKGRIVAIRPHGEGFIIYSTKSIVYVRQDVGATFQWNPVVVLSDSGIAYPHEVSVSTPDTTHYAWATTGMYEITNGTAKVIVPEITDFLKESNDPMYLKMLGGRYLTFSILDATYINGLTQFTTSSTGALSYSFPTATTVADYAAAVTLTGTDVCYNMNAIFQGQTATHQAAAEAARAVAGTPAKGSGFYQPLYTAYLSKPGAMDSDVTWVATPVATVMPNGTDANMCPSSGDGGLLSSAGSTTANHVAVAGSDAYVDGWTIERFVAVQSAIWEAEENARAAFNAAIVNRAASGSATVDSAIAVNTPADHQEATIGRYIRAAHGRHFGYNTCSFWLTRYIDEAFDLIRVKSTGVSSSTKSTSQGSFIVAAGSGGTIGAPAGVLAAMTGDITSIAQAAVDARNAAYIVENGPGAQQVHMDYAVLVGSTATAIGNDAGNNYPVGTGVAGVGVTMSCPAGYTASSSGTVAVLCTPTLSYSTTTTTNAYNRAKDVVIAPTTDTGFCVITGWKYTDVGGVTRTIAAAGGCALPTAPSLAAGTNGSSTLNGDPISNPMSNNGTFCSIPFSPVTIPAIQATPITWPTETVTYPGATFLLQNGSIGPVYPTLVGALVYDTQLKKWGKLKLNYSKLLDYSPINSSAGAIISSDVFGVRAGALLSSGTISLFDSLPADSYIKYGKIGYYRLGMTTTEEVKIGFRSPSTGILSVETSLDGRTIESLIGMAGAYTNALSFTLNGGTSGRWHNIEVRGNYDITHLQYRGTVNGRR